MKIFDIATLNDIWRDILITPLVDEVNISSINTDTRQLVEGQTFVAVSGENFDAHQFVETAVQKGANAVVVERFQAGLTVPQIIVANTRLALGALAAAIRHDFTGSVVGLTGSVGKTTNKQMLASIFSQVGKTHATKGNLNNDLGVPFTWFDLPNDADYAVIEMGANHQREIAYLADITRPNVGMITNAGEAHLEGFGGLDGVAKGKGELFQALNTGDVAILNIDDAYAGYWRDLLSDEVDIVTFALCNQQADVYADAINADGGTFILCHGNQRQPVSLPVIGRHNIMNALGCAACAVSLGVSLANIAKGLSLFETAKGRLQRHQRGGCTIIDDTYNANPLSMRASADILQRSSDYRVMVIGDMGELGSDEMSMHAQLGCDLSEKADTFLCFGDKMRAFSENNLQAKHFEQLSLLQSELVNLLEKEPSATVLIKGSRSMRMERVVDYLLDTLH